MGLQPLSTMIDQQPTSSPRHPPLFPKGAYHSRPSKCTRPGHGSLSSPLGLAPRPPCPSLLQAPSSRSLWGSNSGDSPATLPVMICWVLQSWPARRLPPAGHGPTSLTSIYGRLGLAVGHSLPGLVSRLSGFPCRLQHPLMKVLHWYIFRWTSKFDE